MPELFGFGRAERVLSLEDIFLSHEFGRAARVVPVTAPTSHASTTRHQPRGRAAGAAMGAAGGIAAALVLVMGLATSSGSPPRPASLRADRGPTVTSG